MCPLSGDVFVGAHIATGCGVICTKEESGQGFIRDREGQEYSRLDSALRTGNATTLPAPSFLRPGGLPLPASYPPVGR